MQKIKLNFEDQDPKIRRAREIARQYLHDAIKLANPGLNGEKLESRNLLDTLRVTLEVHPDDPAMRKFMEERRPPEESDIFPREYNPEREKRETEEAEEQVRKEKRTQHLNAIVTTMELLANWQVAELDREYVSDYIIPLLKQAPQFIAQEIKPEVIEDEQAAHKNLANVEHVAREIKARLYPTLPPASAEITHDDHHHTKMILRYVDKRSKVAELAFNNFLTAIQKVNDALDGQGRIKG